MYALLEKIYSSDFLYEISFYIPDLLMGWVFFAIIIVTLESTHAHLVHASSHYRHYRMPTIRTKTIEPTLWNSLKTK